MGLLSCYVVTKRTEWKVRVQAKQLFNLELHLTLRYPCGVWVKQSSMPRN